MRRIQTVTVGDADVALDIEVREVRLGEALDLVDRLDAVNLGNLRAALDEAVQRWTSLDSLDALKRFTPSELRGLWEAFQEVNGDFFAAARRVGLDGLANEILTRLGADLRGYLLASFGPGTEPQPSTTD